MSACGVGCSASVRSLIAPEFEGELGSSLEEKEEEEEFHHEVDGRCMQ